MSSRRVVNFNFSNPNIFNEVYIGMLYDTNKVNILYGGRGSGKSDFVAQKILIDLMTQKYCRVMLVRKRLNSIKNSQWQTLLDYINMWGLDKYFKKTKNPMELLYVYNEYNKINAIGLDDTSKLKSFKDYTYLWIEEADEIKQEDYMVIKDTLRNSNTDKFKIFITFNPQRENHWLNEFFFPKKETYQKDDGNFHYVKSKKKDTTILHTTYKDNRFLSKTTIDEYEKNKTIDENYYNVNTLGLWGQSKKGKVFQNWSIYSDKDLNSKNYNKKWDIIYGLDYGFSNDPTALVQLRWNGKDIYCEEMIYERGLNHIQLVEKMKNNFGDILKDKMIIVDSAEPALISLLKQYGFKAIPAKKGAGTVIEGINMMQNYNFNIRWDSKNVIKEFEEYMWKVVNGEQVDDVVRINDHSLDAIRYVIMNYGVKYWKPVEVSAEKADFTAEKSIVNTKQTLNKYRYR